MDERLWYNTGRTKKTKPIVRPDYNTGRTQKAHYTPKLLAKRDFRGDERCHKKGNHIYVGPDVVGPDGWLPIRVWNQWIKSRK